MLYEDKYGKIRVPEELEELTYWEIEELGIHVWEGSKMEV